jgi:hypothetical protein
MSAMNKAEIIAELENMVAGKERNKAFEGAV